MRNIKTTVDKLYDFIFKISYLLEEELDELDNTKSCKSGKTKEKIVSTLGKLVILLARLNKISKEDMEEDFEITQYDQEIIMRCFERYKLAEEKIINNSK